jgi:hypothetical protein
MKETHKEEKKEGSDTNDDTSYRHIHVAISGASII